MPTSIEVDDHKDVEQKYVKEVYDVIAAHFASTRTKGPWAPVKAYLNKLPDHSVVLDVGCGNGKYFLVNPRLFMAGLDQSAELAKIAIKSGNPLGLTVGNATALPFSSGAFDHVLSIAVLHHLSDPATRATMLGELIRVTRPGGTVFVSVWSTNAPSAGKRKGPGQEPGQDRLVPWHLQKKFADDDKVAKAQTPHDNTGDTRNLEVFYRYYHFFREGELEEAVRDAAETCGREVSVEVSSDKGNWYAEITVH
ncbi:Methyltransferase domain [Carpediemonas membranifera]|uniref:Methyltransferase domain n=1 Tax=Carpediemonas membranifera TaxID=201153 RepID=A0A8J6BBR7_9EUKA|nr:Methyltransferase domain [Carpediemonas membranifera]|eukprot:KAG9397469.1 Methyltransferase domain [Carpediemonas membranifera]